MSVWIILYRVFYRNGFCYDCLSDINCFIVRLYHCLVTKLKISDICKNFHINIHFTPQIWSCELHRDISKYQVVIHSHERVNDLLSTFVMQSSVSTVDKKSLLSRVEQKSIHSTKEMSQQFYQYIYRSPELLFYLHAIYNDDYNYFGLPRHGFHVNEIK